MEKVNLEITNLGMNFEGIGRKDGKVFFVPFALDGEIVKAEVIEDKAKFCKCNLLEILKPSKDRVTPFCPYYEKCGGCDLQHLLYSKQLEYKTRHVKETIEKISGLSVEVEPIIASKNIFYYRNKGAFPVSDEIGMFKTGSHEVVNVNQCFLMKDEITSAYQIVKNFLKENNIEGYNFKTNRGNVKYIVIRYIAGVTLVCLVLKNKISNLDLLYKQLSEKLKVGLYLNYYNSFTKDILSKKFEFIAGEKTITLNEFDISYQLDMASFMQINDDIKEKLYEAVSNEINGEIVIDAYAGAGLLSAIIARQAKKVYSVEIVKPASQSAENLKKLNKIENMEVINGDCAEILPEISKSLEKFTAIIDPARAGCDERVLRSILKADKIIYVSCNPITLARDLKFLLDSHKIEKIQPFDMFPNTKHLETMVVLKRK